MTNALSRILCRGTMVLAVAAAGCGQKIDGPTPKVTALAPPLVCVEQLVTEVTLHGSGLSPAVLGTLTDERTVHLPKLVLTHELTLAAEPGSGAQVTIPDDPADPAASHVRWYSKAEMRFDVFPELALATGVWGIRVTNPDGETAAVAGALLGVAPPVLDAVEPDLVCTAEGPRPVTLHGANFLIVDTSVPTVDVGGLVLVPTYDVADCVTLPGPLANVRLCTALHVEVPAATAAGTYPVTVTNPAPAGCATATPRDLFIVPPPTLLAIQPVNVCMSGGDTVLSVTGADFLDIDGNLPTVAFDDGAAEIYVLTPAAGDMAGCVAMPGPTETVRVCTSFLVTLPRDAAATTTLTYGVSVTNPEPAGCSSDLLDVTNDAPPTITSPTSAAVAYLCQGGGDVDIVGTNLRAGAAVRLWQSFAAGTNGVAASSSEASGCDAQGACTNLKASFGFLPSSLLAAPADLAVENADHCEAAALAAVVVTNGILVLYADPPVIYDEFNNTLTVYAANAISSDIVHVELVPPAPHPAITLCDDAGATPCGALSGATSGAFTVNVPQHTLQDNLLGQSEATFGLRVRTAGLPCEGLLVDGVRIVSVPVTASMQLAPAYGREGEATAVNITLTDHPVGTTFVASPRAYLTTATSGGPLRSVTFVSDTALTAVVPESFTISAAYEDFDLTVVNPDGTVFVQPQAFRLSSFDPPRIDGISPGQLPANTASTLEVLGAGFSSSPSKPVVTLRCQSAAGTPLAPIVLAAASVTVASATSVTLGIPGTIGADTACIIEITNTQDQASDRFSSLVFGNSSGNIPVGRMAPTQLTTARHGHGVSFVAATRAAHFLYAAGGASAADAAVTSVSATPFALVDGDTLLVAADGGAAQTVTVAAASFVAIGAATAAEVAAVLNGALVGAGAAATADGRVAISTDSGGAAGSIQVAGGTANGVLGFPTTVVQGLPTQLLDTVELSATELTGAPTAFTLSRQRLNTPRTHLGLVHAGRALYAVGGEDASGAPLASVERAVVLDPAEVVRIGIDNFDFASPGLGQGGWIYQVAIVFAADDALNPCGESLPSEPFVIHLPDVADAGDPARGLSLALGWNEPNDTTAPGSSFAGRAVGGYRIYRTPMADAPLVAIEYLADVDGATTTVWVDNGAGGTGTITGCAAASEGQKPLTLGETSRWVVTGVPQLGQARKGAGIVAVPAKSSGDVYLYAMSGLGAGATALDDYEVLALAHDVTGNPIAWEGGATTWTRVTGIFSGTCSDSAPRWQAGLFLFNRESSSATGASFAIPDPEQYLVLGPGLGRAAFDGWLIDEAGGGQLNPVASVADCKGSGAATGGYGNIGINQRIFTYGGDGNRNTIKAVVWSRVAGPPPSLRVGASYNANGVTMLTDRYLHGSVLDRAFIYLVGGYHQGTRRSLASVEYGVW